MLVPQNFFDDEMGYLFLGDSDKNQARVFIEDILTFIILYNNLIPIRCALSSSRSVPGSDEAAQQFDRHDGSRQVRASSAHQLRS